MPKAFTFRNQVKSLYSFIEYFMINQKEPEFLQSLRFLISEVQYLAILLWMQSILFAFDDLNPASIFIYKITRVIVFKSILEEELPMSFLEGCTTFLWVYFSLMLLILGCFGFMAIKQQMINQSLQKVIHTLFQFHFGVVFWFANMVFMILISFKSKGINILLFSPIENMEEFYHAIQLFLIILNYALGLITSVFSFDPFYADNLFSMQSSSFQFLTFLFKTLAAPLAVFSNPSHLTTQMIFITVAFTISSAKIICIFRRFALHHYKPAKLASFFGIIGLWISCTNIIAIICLYYEKIHPFSLFYLTVLPLPLTIKLALVRLTKIIDFYAIISSKSLLKKREIYGKLFANRAFLKQIRLSLNENISLTHQEIYFIGKLVSHSPACGDSECLCSSFLKDKNKLTPTSMMNLRASVLAYFYSNSLSLLSEAIKRIKRNNDLKINLAHLIFTNPVNRLNSALAHLFSVSDEGLNLLGAVKKHMLLLKIQGRLSNFFSESSSEKLDMRRFIAYHDDTENFLSQIISTTDQFLKLWESFKKPNMKISDIIEKSYKIEQNADKIDRLWNRGVEKYESFYRLMKEPYRVYLCLVRNTPSLSAEVIHKLQWKNKARNEDPSSNFIREGDLVESKIMSFYVSMMRERIGKVVYSSKNIQNSLGYGPEDIMGKNINCLMPACFATKHDQILLRHLDRSKASETKDYYNSSAFIKTKAGSIMPCATHITIFPYIQHELLYLGVIKVINSEADYMIIDSWGHIDSFTENVGKKLNLSSHKKKHIQEICSETDKLGIHFEKGNQNTRLGSGTSETKVQEGSLKDNNILNFNNTEKSLKTKPNGKEQTLRFIKQNSASETVKYFTKVTKRIIFDKNVYVFELYYKPIQPGKYQASSLENLKINIPLNSAFDVLYERPSPHRIQKTNQSPKSKPHLTGYQNLDSERLYLKEPSSARKLDLQSEMSENVPRKRPSYALIYSNLHTKFDSIKEAVTPSDREPAKQKGESIRLPNAYDTAPYQSEKASTASIAYGAHSKLEKAVYSIPKNRPLKILMFLVMVSILVAFSLLLIFFHQTIKNLDVVKGNLSVITTSNLRLFQIADINRRARIISLYANGFIDDKRYWSYGVKSVVPTMVALLNSTQKSLMTYNTQARIALEQIDSNLQRNFFSNLIPVIDPDEQEAIQFATVFNAATILMIKIKQLVKTNPQLITEKNYNMNFLLNNTLNEQLLTSEEVTNIMLGDNEIKLNSPRDIITCYILICCMLSISFIIFFNVNQFKFIQNRNKLIEIFLKFSDEEIDQNMNKIRAFKNDLFKDGFEYKYTALEELPLSPKSQSRAAKLVKRFGLRSREANKQGLNLKIYLAQVLVLAIVFILIAPFVSVSAFWGTKKNVITEEVNTIVKVNSILYDINLISAAIYEYIQLNRTTKVRTRPINQELETTLSRLSNSQEFFSKLIQIKSESKILIDEEIEPVLTGDLCKVMNANPIICRFGKGMFEKGIIGLNSFVLLTLRRVKDLYDTSDMSFQSQKRVISFSNLIDLEYIYAVMQLPAYKRLGDILQNRIENHIQEMIESLRTAVICSIFAYVLLGYAGLKCLWTIVEKERVKWKKFLRVIPFKIIISNTVLKNYIARESNYLLDSVQNNL